MSGARKRTCISGVLRVLDRNGPFGAVQALHQVAEAWPARGPGAVDGDELGVVDERLGEAVGIVGVPGRVEAVFELRGWRLRRTGS